MQLLLGEKLAQPQDIARLVGATQKAEGYLREPIAPAKFAALGATWRSAQSRVGASVMHGAVSCPWGIVAGIDP